MAGREGYVHEKGVCGVVVVGRVGSGEGGVVGRYATRQNAGKGKQFYGALRSVLNVSPNGEVVVCFLMVNFIYASVYVWWQA